MPSTLNMWTIYMNLKENSLEVNMFFLKESLNFLNLISTEFELCHLSHKH